MANAKLAGHSDEDLWAELLAGQRRLARKPEAFSLVTRQHRLSHYMGCRCCGQRASSLPATGKFVITEKLSRAGFHANEPLS